MSHVPGFNNGLNMRTTFNLKKYTNKKLGRSGKKNKGFMVVLTFFNLYLLRTVRKVLRCTPPPPPPLIKRVLAFYLPSSKSPTNPSPPLTQRKKFYSWKTIPSQQPSLSLSSPPLHSPPLPPSPPPPPPPPPLPTSYNGFWISDF